MQVFSHFFSHLAPRLFIQQILVGSTDIIPVLWQIKIRNNNNYKLEKLIIIFEF